VQVSAVQVMEGTSFLLSLNPPHGWAQHKASTVLPPFFSHACQASMHLLAAHTRTPTPEYLAIGSPLALHPPSTPCGWAPTGGRPPIRPAPRCPGPAVLRGKGGCMRGGLLPGIQAGGRACCRAFRQEGGPVAGHSGRRAGLLPGIQAAKRQKEPVDKESDQMLKLCTEWYWRDPIQNGLTSHPPSPPHAHPCVLPPPPHTHTWHLHPHSPPHTFKQKSTSPLSLTPPSLHSSLTRWRVSQAETAWRRRRSRTARSVRSVRSVRQRSRSPRPPPQGGRWVRGAGEG
jgi:hypothetical protein